MNENADEISANLQRAKTSLQAAKDLIDKKYRAVKVAEEFLELVIRILTK